MDDQTTRSKGAIYVAFGYEYVIQALNSIRSLKSIHPELPVTIVTNLNINNINQQKLIDKGSNNPLFDNIIFLDIPDKDNRLIKTKVNEYSPYDDTLYLDCDTIVKSSIIEGYNLLEYFDLCIPAYPIPPHHMVNSWNGDIHLSPIELEYSSYWGGGIRFFKNDTTSEFFEMWNHCYKKYGYQKDQFSLIHAIFTSDVRIHPLDLTWDVTDNNINWHDEIRNNIRIYHYTHAPFDQLRQVEASIGGALISDESIPKNEIRNEFRSKYSRKNELTRKIAKNELVVTLGAKKNKIIERFEL